VRSRPVTALLTGCLLALGAVGAAGPARADAAVTLTAPAGLLADGSPRATDGYSVALTSPVANSVTFTLSGVVNLSPATVALTCDRSVTPTPTLSQSGSTVTGTCSGAASMNSPYTGSLTVMRGAQGSRLGNGTLTMSVDVRGATGLIGHDEKTIAVSTPPSLSESVSPQVADSQSRLVTANLSNHSSAYAGSRYRIDLALSGVQGLTPTAVTVGVVQSDGSVRFLPLNQSGAAVGGELTSAIGTVPADLAVPLTYQVSFRPTVHGGNVTFALTLRHIDGAGGDVAPPYDSDSDTLTLVNKPKVTTTLPASVVVDAVPATFSQTLTNRSGSGVNARVDYAVTAPVGMKAEQLKLEYVSSNTWTRAPFSGTAPNFTTSLPVQSLVDQDTTVSGPALRLSVVNGAPTFSDQAPSGPLNWSITIADTSTGTTVSDPHTPTTVVQRPPGAPRAVVAAGGNTKLTVSFDPGDNGSAPPFTYIVTATKDGQTYTAQGPASPVVVRGLVNHSTYTVSVRTRNALATDLQDTGPPSASVQGTPVPEVPGAPTLGATDPGDGFAMVAVAAPADDGGSPVMSYRATFFRTDGIGAASSVISAEPNITLPGLTNSHQYEVLVRAGNSVGYGPAAPPAFVTPLLPGGPTSPIGIRVSIDQDRDVVTKGTKVLLSGLVTRSAEPQPGLLVKVGFVGGDKKATVLSTVTTDSLGFWRLVVQPKISGTYVASVVSVNPAVPSSEITVGVQAVLSRIRTTRAGGIITVTGLFTPGVKLSRSVSAPKIQLQVVTLKGGLVTKVAKLLATGKVLPLKRSSNAFRLSSKVLKPGTYYIRVVSVPTPLYTSGVSPPVKVRWR
jgi:hypothetical protein